MDHKRGFTLIELMIVIAIIAIIAAIAIPGLLASQRASNERNASASMKTISTAEADFRSNDRDGNHINDFWTYDVSGLYSIFPPGATSSAAVKLLDISVAGADITNAASIATTATTGGTTIITSYATPSPKAGYWYYAMVSDMTQGTGAAYSQDTDGSGSSLHNNSTFGFGSYPDSFSAGRQIFIINEGNVIFKRQTIGTVRSGTANPPAAFPQASGVTNPTDDPKNMPNDTSQKADYTKMD